MKNKFDFQPKLFTALRNYSKERFMTDLMAGIIVGIVALPLAIAFGIASGVSPEKGLITAIIGGFIVSLLGGCNVQIGGPTGAFIVIVYGIIQNFGIEGLAIATVIAGIILVLMGVLKLGTVIKFIPYPIVVGFTSGIAITIFTTQMKDLFASPVLRSSWNSAAAAPAFSDVIQDFRSSPDAPYLALYLVSAMLLLGIFVIFIVCTGAGLPCSLASSRVNSLETTWRASGSKVW